MDDCKGTGEEVEICSTIGKFMIDSHLLRLGGVYNELIRPTDFASDNLVKALVRYPTIEKLKGPMQSLDLLLKVTRDH